MRIVNRITFLGRRIASQGATASKNKRSRASSRGWSPMEMSMKGTYLRYNRISECEGPRDNLKKQVEKHLEIIAEGDRARKEKCRRWIWCGLKRGSLKRKDPTLRSSLFKGSFKPEGSWGLGENGKTNSLQFSSQGNIVKGMGSRWGGGVLMIVKCN